MYEREEIKCREQLIRSPSDQDITGTYILSAQQKDLNGKKKKEKIWPLVGVSTQKSKYHDAFDCTLLTTSPTP